MYGVVINMSYHISYHNKYFMTCEADTARYDVAQQHDCALSADRRW